MSVRSLSGLVALILSCPSCATSPGQPVAVVLTPDVKELAGWLSARGEWTLFPDRHRENYDPYTRDENAKCVSVVNGTGQPRAAFRELDGRPVIIQGQAVDYDKLQEGNSAADQLLSKRYYAGELVENSCLRQYVFVATALIQR